VTHAADDASQDPTAGPPDAEPGALPSESTPAEASLAGPTGDSWVPTPTAAGATPPGSGGGGPTWAASAEAPPGWGSSVPPATPPSGRRGSRRWPAVLAAALVGAIVGAGSAAGVYLSTDDEPESRETTVVVGPATELENPGDIAEILARVQPATVAIRATGNLGAECGPPLGGEGEVVEGAGSGFVLSSDGFVVTNSHVVGGATEIFVDFANGNSLAAEIVGRDAAADLAVLKVDAEALPTVELGSSEEVAVGDAVVAIGNALGLRGTPSVTSGIVSALDRTVPTECNNNLESAIQTDAAINRGNSGGPLVDAEGRVIGINTAIADPAVAQNVGFAIPISEAAPIIEDLQAGRLPAFLGVSTRTVDDAVQAELELDVSSGALIVEITPDSPAEAADLESGDVIVRIGDRGIETSQDVVNAVRDHDPGDQVDVVANRDGEEVTASVTLAERPDAS